MSHIDVCLCLCVRYQWLIMVLMLGISSGYWLRHKPNPRGDDFLAPTANQLVYGDLFTYTRVRMWLCARMHVCEFDNTHTQKCTMSQNLMTAALSACHHVPLSSSVTLRVCWSLLSIGALMRRVFVLRTISMVFQSSLLTVLEPSPLMKGRKDSNGFTRGTHNEDVVRVVQILDYLVVCLLVSVIMLHAHPLFLYEFYTFRCNIIYLSHPHVTYYFIFHFITFLYNAGRITWC